jgi:hypothetical protein
MADDAVLLARFPSFTIGPVRHRSIGNDHIGLLDFIDQQLDAYARRVRNT